MSLGFDRFAEEITAQAASFADTVAGADMTLPVPTCPEWTLKDLIHHVGRAYYWPAAMIASRSTTFVSPADAPEGVLPDDPDQYSEWLRAGAARLVAVVAEIGPESIVWTWAEDRRAGFWLRRITHETVVHRADAAITLGSSYDVAPDLAADGITEGLSLLAARVASGRQPSLAELAGTGQTLHFHATDEDLGADGEWFVRRTPNGPVWEPGHGKADVAVRGRAADLLLTLNRRVPVAEAKLEVFGDTALLDHWLEHTRF